MTNTTDPVNTDALRTPYDHFPDLRQAYSEGFERAHVEVDRLRAVIENAPHARTCELEEILSTSSRWDRECTCWKAGAL